MCANQMPHPQANLDYPQGSLGPSRGRRVSYPSAIYGQPSPNFNFVSGPAPTWKMRSHQQQSKSASRPLGFPRCSPSRSSKYGSSDGPLAMLNRDDYDVHDFTTTTLKQVYDPSVVTQKAGIESTKTSIQVALQPLVPPNHAPDNKPSKPGHIAHAATQALREDGTTNDFQSIIAIANANAPDIPRESARLLLILNLYKHMPLTFK
ncbi:hypothetical protein NHQ30_006684 [Ciborinia camelliae]|nr:hypothetical protein NHQ30_006684 [Ciborinia camelliae]